MVPVISAIILAAGESRRMGRPKQLMPWGKTTILEHTVDNFLNSKVSHIIVVVGYRAEEVARLVANKPVTIARNAAYQAGMSTSIVAGLSSISDKTQGIMLALADQPLIDSQTIDYLITSFAAADKGIVIPTYHGQRGHPVIFALKYKEELLSVQGDTGGREIIDRHPDDVVEVMTDCKGICFDIDTEDIYNLKKRGLK